MVKGQLTLGLNNQATRIFLLARFDNYKKRRFFRQALARVAIVLLGIAIAFLPLLIDPGVGQVGDLGDERKFLAAEAGRGLPFVAVLVEARDGHVVARAVVRFVRPDRRFDAAQADFVNGFLLRVIGTGLLRALVVGHCTVLSLKREKGWNQAARVKSPAAL